MPDASIASNQAIDLTAGSLMSDGTTENLSDADPGAQVAWSVDDPTVVSLSANAGFITIVAALPGAEGKTATINCRQDLSDGRSFTPTGTVLVTKIPVTIVGGVIVFGTPTLQ